MGKYQFTGKVPVGLTEAASRSREELERIDELIRQLEGTARTARIGVIDLEALAEFAEPGDLEALQRMQESRAVRARTGSASRTRARARRFSALAASLSSIPGAFTRAVVLAARIVSDRTPSRSDRGRWVMSNSARRVRTSSVTLPHRWI
ncbi:MAG: hypothetical protein R3B96_23625 [Pirellulaceae bacterium]